MSLAAKQGCEMSNRSNVNRRLLVRAGWALAWLMAIVNVLAGVLAALEQSPGVPWSSGQGHLLYLLRLPLSGMPAAWAQACWVVVNLLLLRAFVRRARASLSGRVSRLWWTGAVLLLCISLPVADVLLQGQATLFSLCGLLMGFLYRRMPLLAGVGLAMALCSWGVGLMAVAVMLVAGFVGAVAVAALIGAAVWLLTSQMLGVGVWVSLWQPLTMAGQNLPTGACDLMPVCQVMRDQLAWPAWLGISAVVGVNLAFLGLLASRRPLLYLHGSALAQALGAAALMALGSFSHPGGDAALCLFLLWAQLLVGKGRVDTAFVRMLLWVFGLLWLAPRLGHLLPVDPFADGHVVLAYCLTLMASAFMMSSGALGRPAMARMQVPWWAGLIDPAADEVS
jgi:hypothetical protein